MVENGTNVHVSYVDNDRIIIMKKSDYLFNKCIFLGSLNNRILKYNITSHIADHPSQLINRSFTYNVIKPSKSAAIAGNHKSCFFFRKANVNAPLYHMSYILILCTL